MERLGPAEAPPLKLLICGSGIAGLFTALSLSGQGHDITLVERDGPPPEAADDTEGAERAFFDWERQGAAQFRHPHAFLGLMCSLIEAHHPTSTPPLPSGTGEWRPMREGGAGSSSSANFLPLVFFDTTHRIASRLMYRLVLSNSTRNCEDRKAMGVRGAWSQSPGGGVKT